MEYQYPSTIPAPMPMPVPATPMPMPIGFGAATLPPRETIWGYVYGVGSLAGVITGAYHGYKRNNSIGWAVGWAILGGIVPFVTIPLSFAQGFAKPGGGSRRRNGGGWRSRRPRGRL